MASFNVTQNRFELLQEGLRVVMLLLLLRCLRDRVDDQRRFVLVVLENGYVFEYGQLYFFLQPI